MTAAAPSAPGGQVRAATEHLARAAHLVDPILDAVIPPAETSPSDLHRAMRHLVFPGGKRLRPALALSACEAVGGDPVAALHAAGDPRAQVIGRVVAATEGASRLRLRG